MDHQPPTCNVIRETQDHLSRKRNKIIIIISSRLPSLGWAGNVNLTPYLLKLSFGFFFLKTTVVEIMTSARSETRPVDHGSFVIQQMKPLAK